MKKASLLLIILVLLLASCNTKTDTPEVVESVEVIEAYPADENEVSEEVIEPVQEEVIVDASLGKQYTEVLSKTKWQGTRVYDAEDNDLTEFNSNFIGLAKYDQNTNRYEFFDKETFATRGDKGVFFITDDGSKRILISQKENSEENYQAAVDITELNDNIFTYKRMGVDAEGNQVEVFVEHIPYGETELEFTTPAPVLELLDKNIEQAIPGNEILSATLWNGTKVFDEEGNEVTEFNSQFLSIALFEAGTNKYEFFDIATGESRGDFGYYAIVHNNFERAHMSMGANPYGAVLELTELNNLKFTYKRTGKNANDEDITIFVEHEPYTGEFAPSLTF